MANKPKTNVSINGYDYAKVYLYMGKDEKGNNVHKAFYGSSKTEAENKKKQYIKELESGINPDLGNQSLSQSMYTWLWEIEKRSGNKSSSFERYEGIYRNYVKAADIGLLKMSDIKKLAIQKYYNFLQDNGKSYSQIQNLHKLLNKFFNYAESEGYIIKNPCKGIKIPKSDEDEVDEEDRVIETFSSDEIKLLTDNLGHTKLKYIILFALLTGCRRGEILALEEKNLTNYEKVKINKTLRNIKVYDDRENYHYELKATKPKTKSSRREVPIPDILKPELKQLKKLVAEEKLRLGPLYKDNNLLFPSETGTYIDAKNLQRSWKRALERYDIPYRKFHALRHTYATTLFEKGANIVTVSKLLGHSTIKTTEIYTHVLENVKEKEVQVLNEFFS
mgnify:CR=1 FL=1